MQAGSAPFTVDLTNEEMQALSSAVDWYDKNWMIDGIRTRSAELYDESHEAFHRMAQAFASAASRCEDTLPDSAEPGPVEGVAAWDLFVAATASGFRVSCGYSAGRLLWYTVYEASRGPGPDPVIWRLSKKMSFPELRPAE